jgi:hypothetical protein
MRNSRSSFARRPPRAAWRDRALEAIPTPVGTLTPAFSRILSRIGTASVTPRGTSSTTWPSRRSSTRCAEFPLSKARNWGQRRKRSQRTDAQREESNVAIRRPCRPAASSRKLLRPRRVSQAEARSTSSSVAGSPTAWFRMCEEGASARRQPSSREITAGVPESGGDHRRRSRWAESSPRRLGPVSVWRVEAA